MLRKFAKTGLWLIGLCFVLTVGCATRDISDVSVQLASELNGRVQISMGKQKVVLNFKALVKEDRANLEVWGTMGINRQRFMLISEPPTLKQKIGKHWIELSTKELANRPISELPLSAFPYWIMGLPRASSPYIVLEEGSYSNSFIQDNWEIEVIRSNQYEDGSQSRSKLYPTEIIMTSGVLSVRWLIKTFEKNGSRFDRGLLHQENNVRS
ncbi:MAG: lipoprotein insertase outer membrane protein LolB [Pseudomonadota bacterium]|nr:lipoprotein insertase outer membrane protein LolB [Pseudomonadota bacterium]